MIRCYRWRQRITPGSHFKVCVKWLGTAFRLALRMVVRFWARGETMHRIISSQPSRRSLLASATAFVLVGTTLARARTLSGSLPWEAGTATPPVVVRPGPWMFFTADEAAVIEAAVDRLIPSDSRGPRGKEAGSAAVHDRHFPGPYGRAEGLYTRPPFMPGAATQGYQLPDSPAAPYRTSLRSLPEYITRNFPG